MRKGNIKTNEKENINVNEKKKSNIDKRKLISLIISLLLIISSIATVVAIGVIGILPFKYMIALILGLVVINSLLGFILLKNRKGKKTRIVINIIQVLMILVEIFAISYVIKTYKFMDEMTEGTDTKKENYSVIVLKDSKYNEVKDLKDKVIEYYSNELSNSELALEMLKEEVDVSAVSSDDIYEVGKTLLKGEVDAILVEESQKMILDEQLKEFAEKTRVIHTLAVDISVETIAKEAAVASEPFIIYISGIDTYGTISSVSRSDVNMVAVVNPKSYQVLLVNIPRDYYVQLHGRYGKRDKLTHAGMYGVEMSVKTIEDLLDIDINYYFKVNFTSLEAIVDAIGGIEVNSEYAFTSYIGKYKFTKGINKLDGKRALAFARERKSFASGDRMRGKNQQAVLSAIIDKASTPSIITKFDGLLKSLSNKFQTNMETKKMMELVKLQISKMPTWNVSMISLTGGDARALAYSSGNTPLYVMIPSQNSINDVKAKITAAINGETLLPEYDSISGSISGLREVEIPPVADEKDEEIIEDIPEELPEDIIDDTNNENNDNSENNQTDNNENNENSGTNNDSNSGDNSGENNETIVDPYNESQTSN